MKLEAAFFKATEAIVSFESDDHDDFDRDSYENELLDD